MGYSIALTVYIHLLSMGIRIFIYEDNDSLRNSMKLLLQLKDDVESITPFSNAVTVLEDIATLNPDVIIMDIDMPERSGIEALSVIRSKYPQLPVIMFTVFEDDENIYNAICAGANGYLLKRNFDQISHAITDVLTGGAPMTSSIAKKVLEKISMSNTGKKSSPKIDLLSDRENEILRYIVEGYSYKLIAIEIGIAVDTVRTHIKNIYKKLQVNNATQAVQQYHKGNR